MQSLKPFGDKKPKIRNSQTTWGVYDIEARKWLHHVISASYWEGCDDEYDQNFNFHKSVNDFLVYLFSEECRMTEVWCHFGGIYDFLFILQEVFLKDDIFVEKMMPRGSGLLQIVISNGSKKVTFKDSSAILPFGLDTITKSFGVSHLKKKMDRTKITRATKEVKKYLEHDCKGLYESIKKFKEWPLIKEVGMKSTVASQSIQILKKYLPCEVPSLSTSVDRFIRGGYFGGRVEIYKPLYISEEENNKPINYYDINSLYPYCMKKTPVPIEYKGYMSKLDLGKTVGFAECTIQIPDMYCPPLPWVDKMKSGKLIFPTGVVRGIWSTLELEYAVSLGVKILEFHSGQEFLRAVPIFEKFVDSIYALRMQGQINNNTVDNFLSKLILNACYGRFGLERVREELTLNYGNSGGMTAYNFYSHDGNIFGIDRKEVAINSFSHVGIAAWITSAARIENHITQKKLFFNVSYTDTDSFFTPENVPTGKALGDLKKEYELKNACFLLPKTYLIESSEKDFKYEKESGEVVRSNKKLAMKGFDKVAINAFTLDDFMAALEGDFRALKIPTPQKLARMKSAWSKGQALMLTEESSKQIRSYYDKRRVIKTLSGKYDTEPLIVKDGEIINLEKRKRALINETKKPLKLKREKKEIWNPNKI